MTRIAVVCAAAAIAIGCVAPRQAAAGDNFVAGLVGGLAAGTFLGIAASSPRVYYVEPVYVEPVYVPTCYWTRGRPVWDGYRGIWVRPRVQVCD
jgi:hypothetical protein